ncbi:MAG: nicotinate phosphoribosyltransferase [Proteobacteria bacterium]|nr:nicotinate phosphoribosyltransferase [Pseudomonadota bacterium]
MSYLDKHSGLFTDLYELTMAQIYYLSGRDKDYAIFDYFFRKTPFEGGFVVFAGLETLLDALTEFKFDNEDLVYLKSLGFKDDFLSYLKNFHFKGTIYSVKEGEVVFPKEPVIRVEGNIIETQIIETLLLNIINFQSLIATKARRIKLVAGDRVVVDFGLRRAQSLAGIYATRSAVIGGIKETSNLYSAFKFGIKPVGTMAHSFVQSFDSEYEAFLNYSKIYPDKTILLVDTYNTVKSGIPNAIKIAKKLEKEGHKLIGVRIDSGDIAKLSKISRNMLNKAGLDYVKIIASNKLDEFVIDKLNRKKAPVDVFGVGTNLVTGHGDSALDGVYKLVYFGGKDRLKISEEKEKILLPGRKNILRLKKDEKFLCDVISLENEKVVNTLYSLDGEKKIKNPGLSGSERLLKKVLDNGKIIIKKEPLEYMASFSEKRIEMLPKRLLKLKVSNPYNIYISEKLFAMREKIINELKQGWDKND